MDVQILDARATATASNSSSLSDLLMLWLRRRSGDSGGLPTVLSLSLLHLVRTALQVRLDLCPYISLTIMFVHRAGQTFDSVVKPLI